MKRLMTICVIGLMLAVAGRAGAITLDRNSSSITLNGGTISVLSGGGVQTTGDWVVTGAFQISLYADEGSGPGNDWWEFNHFQPSWYNPGDKYYAPNYNFPDYDFYHLKIDTVNQVAISLFTGGPTGAKADWVLYYTDPSLGSIYYPQTVLSGSVENFVEVGGKVSGFLRLQPYASYHAFDYTEGGEPVNAVEIWNNGYLPTDIVGYNLTVGSPMQLDPTLVPEPGTMLLLGSGIAVLFGFRKRFKRT